MNDLSTSPHCPTDEMLVAFLAGQFPPERSREIASHIATCEECRAWLGGIRDAGKNREKNRKAFRMWVGIATVLGIATIVILVLVVLAGQKIEKLEAKVVRAGPPAGSTTARIVPSREIEPGKVFPVYKRSEPLRVERPASKGVPALYELDPGKGLRRMLDAAGGAIDRPQHRGLLIYLVLDLPQKTPEKEIAEFEKELGDFVRTSQPLIVLGNVGTWLSQRNWEHHLLPVEWEE